MPESDSDNDADADVHLLSTDGARKKPRLFFSRKQSACGGSRRNSLSAGETCEEKPKQGSAASEGGNLCRGVRLEQGGPQGSRQISISRRGPFRRRAGLRPRRSFAQVEEADGEETDGEETDCEQAGGKEVERRRRGSGEEAARR